MSYDKYITPNNDMTELEHARAMVARCEAKRDAASDELSRYYYEQCRIGWVAQVEKLARGG